MPNLVLSSLLLASSTLSTTCHAWISMSSSTSTSSKSLPLPKLEIPPPILSDVPGTWAYDTMSRRVDEEILERTALDNAEAWKGDEWATVRQRFQDLRHELQNAATTPLTYLDNLPEDASAERQKEHAEWKEILEPFIAKKDTWLTAPWMVTEFYLYRRLMQAIGYWDKGTPGYLYDPFDKQKQAGLVSSVASAEGVLSRIPALVKNNDSNNAQQQQQGLTLAASIALWGNKMDLSLWPADAAAGDVFSEILAAASDNLLHDDSEALTQYVVHTLKKNNNNNNKAGDGGAAIDIIVDNAGLELVTDLALGQYLIQSGMAKTVTFQLKSHPTFVSDALEKDLLETVEYYASLDATKYPSAQAAGMLWKEFLQSGQWQCVQDNFWVQPYEMWRMTEPLRTDMATRCDLAFVKGDANYRRLLGDRVWDYTANFGDVVGCYFPCPVCALRTLKAELGCGMDAEQVKRAQELDDNWMTNGRFGVVQFGTGAAAETTD